MRGKLIIFLLVLMSLVGLVGFWFYQKNVYSKGDLKLEILGPTEVQLLEELTYTVKYKNQGNITLQDPRLIFEYPSYSISEKGKLREELNLEDIYPGQERSYQFKARLLGAKGTVKEARAFLSYRPKGLKAFYELQTSLNTTIKGVPLSFEIDLPSKVETGREFSFSLNYFSNLDFPLQNLRVQVDYPFNFEFIKSKPVALEKEEWDIGVLNKTEGGRIEITGRLSGELGEQKLFRAKLGLWQDNEFVLLKETFKATKIVKPLLSVFQRINGVENYVANFNEWLHYEIFFRNIGQQPFLNLFLVSNLESDIFDFNSLRVNQGQFNRQEKSIIWDWREVPQLQFLDSGQEGKVEFWIKLKDVESLAVSPGKKSVLRHRVIISDVKEQFETKVQSKLELAQKVFFEDEIFGNSGSLPPQVDQPTTYTVIWQVSTCCGQVNNIKVKTVLPSNVKLTGNVFPEDLSLTFDPESREVIWQVGDGTPGQFWVSAAFQVSLTPTPSQRGDKALIIEKASISGEDQWTEEVIESTAPAVDTSLPDDKTITEEQGIVQ